MKKLLVAVLAMASVSAFSQTSMVRFSNIGSHDGAGDFNVSTSKDDDGTTETSQTNVALNYAYTVVPQVQVGLGFDYNNGGEEKSMLYTVSAYYNFTTDLTNAWYAGLHYTFGKTTEIAGADTDAKASVIAVEAGKRFALGSWEGFTLTYAPNVIIAQGKVETEGTPDVKNEGLTWNFLKFDVLF